MKHSKNNSSFLKECLPWSKKWLYVMLLFLCIQPVMLFAQNNTISLSLKEAPIRQFFSAIEKQTSYKFSYREVDILNKGTITIKAEKESLQSVLEKVLTNKQLTFSTIDNKILIQPKVVPADVQGTEKKVSGKVLDEKGETIIGASVKVKGSRTGCISDVNGDFSLNASPDATLEISYIGYTPKEVAVNNKTSLVITLVEEMNVLDQVVVVGFATQKRINLTGAISTVNEEYLQSRPVNNTVQALQGIVPGLNISSTGSGGALSSSMDINIRGNGTIGAGSSSSPLILIDGVPGDLNLLNSDDIANISVLKDAGASAIYGSRAAFGVILVTTKRGKEGKVNVNYNNNFRFATPIRTPEFADSYKWALFMNEGQNNAGNADWIDPETMDKILMWQRGEISETNVPASNDPNSWAGGKECYNNVDWYDVHLKKWTFSMDHNLSISGGNERTQYLISLNVLSRDGILKFGTEDSKRYTFNTRVDSKLTKWASVGASFNYIRQDLDEPTMLADSRFGGYGGYFGGVVKCFPTLPIQNPDGSYPLTNMIERVKSAGRIKQQRDVITMQLNAKITPLEGWNLIAEGNYRISDSFRNGTVEPILESKVDGTKPPISLNGSAAFPAGYTEINERAERVNFLNTNIYTDYSRLFNDAHYFKIMAGFNAELNQSRIFGGYRTGLITLSTPSIDTAAGTDKFTEGSYNHWSTAGFFGRLNYNFKERYIFEAVLRYDGSSRFRKENRWNLYPSVSAGWNIAKEKFMEPLQDKINLLKIRASYGNLGNQNTNSLYPYYQTVPFNANNGGWLINGTRPNVAGMPALISDFLSWERVESIDLGLDFGAFNNRLIGSLGFFQRSTLDMVGPAPQLPNTLGVAVPQTNNADLRTQGWEAEVSYRDNIGDFSYSVRATLSDYRTKVTKYPNFTNNISNPVAGEYLNNIWGYTTLGIAKTAEEMNAHLESLPNGGQSALQNGSRWDAGDVMYADLNGDGKIDGGKGVLGDTGDKKVIGNSTPRYHYGITLDVAWKGIDLMLFGQGVGKRDIWISPAGNNGSMFYGSAQGIWQAIILEPHMDYFRPSGTDNPLGENVNSYFPRPIFGGNANKNQEVQTRYLQNGSYFRLKSLQLGYTFPKEWMQKMSIQRLRVYVSGENLITLTKLPRQFDPETFEGSGAGPGRTYPLQATYSFGLSVTF